MIRNQVPAIPTDFIARYHAAALEVYDAADDILATSRRVGERWKAARATWAALADDMASHLRHVMDAPRGPVLMDARMSLMGSLFECLAALVGDTYPRDGTSRRCAICHKEPSRAEALVLRAAEHATGCAWIAAYDLVREIEGETVLLDPADWKIISQALAFARQKAMRPEQREHVEGLRARIDRAAVVMRRPRGTDAAERAEHRREIARAATRRYRERKKTEALAQMAEMPEVGELAVRERSA